MRGRDAAGDSHWRLKINKSSLSAEDLLDLGEMKMEENRVTRKM